MTTFDLPWPDKLLSPNARPHWARKAKAVRLARSAAHVLTFSALAGQKPDWPFVNVGFVFCPPDRRRRDRSNVQASMKAATDGIADALGIDDSRFIEAYAWGEVVKGGLVRVTISAAAQQTAPAFNPKRRRAQESV